MGAVDLNRKPRHETRILHTAILEFLEDEQNRPATTRQVFYNLVTRHVVENTKGRYDAITNELVWLRRKGIVPWEWVDDRNRRPRSIMMFRDLPAFLDRMRTAYRRNPWGTQSTYIEVWLEKEALSGFFEDELHRYGVTLNVGKGYDSWAAVNGCAQRIRQFAEYGIPSELLCFGDFDPSGEDIVRSQDARLRERLGESMDALTLTKCALTMEDVIQYDLPPDFTKATDGRAAAHVAKYGDVSVELDALPRQVLINRLVEAIESRLDMEAMRETWEREDLEHERLQRIIDNVA